MNIAGVEINLKVWWGPVGWYFSILSAIFMVRLSVKVCVCICVYVYVYENVFVCVYLGAERR